MRRTPLFPCLMEFPGFGLVLKQKIVLITDYLIFLGYGGIKIVLVTDYLIFLGYDEDKTSFGHGLFDFS